jgi:hypothetical protein
MNALEYCTCFKHNEESGFLSVEDRYFNFQTEYKAIENKELNLAYKTKMTPEGLPERMKRWCEVNHYTPVRVKITFETISNQPSLVE